MQKKAKEKPPIDLDSLLEDEKKFYFKLQSYIDKVRENYKIRKKKCRFTLLGVEYTCKVSNLITQMIFLIPFVDTGIEPDESFILLDQIKDYNNDTFIDWANNVIGYFSDKDLLDDEYILKLNLSIKKVIQYLSDLSGRCNILSGTTIRLHDLLELYENNKEFRELVDYEIPDGEFSDIEKEINQQFDGIMDILRNVDTCYKPYFRSKTGINEKQFKEVMSSIGLKTDLDGTILPFIVQSNYFKGLRGITEFFVSAMMCRKALITSHQKVKDSGYLTRKIGMLLMDTDLSEVEDCGSKGYINIEITDKKIAERMNMRYFLNKDKELERFDSKTHSKYIGKTLRFRSPIRCRCKDGKICRTCYGDLYKVNKDIKIGIIATLELTEQFTQKLLSAKHLQQTFTEIVEWVKEFTSNFIVDKGMVFIDPDKEKSGSKIIIEDEWIGEVNEVDDTVEISQFIIASKNGKETLIPSPDNISLLLSEETKELVMENSVKDKDNRNMLPFKLLLETDAPVFQFNMLNDELASTLQDAIKLIENAKHPNPFITDKKGKHPEIKNIHEIMNVFLQLLNNGGVHLASVHAELIIRELVRDPEHLTKRPKRFKSEEDYVILRVTEAILNSPSSSVSLSFEQIKKQILTPALYFKDGESILDVLYFQ
jgi:hypothetical protein